MTDARLPGQAFIDDPSARQSPAVPVRADLKVLFQTLFEQEFMAASLDHALWFHRPFRADDWLLYAQDSPNLCGGRGLARGLIFARDGTLVASVAQEGLIRERRPAR